MSELEATRLCKNCQTDLAGAFCAACGQSGSTRRLDLRAALRQFTDSFTALENPLPATLRGLSFAPGRTIARYVDGERIKFIAPLRYAIWFIGLYVLVMQFTDMTPLKIAVTSSAGSEEAAKIMERMTQAVRGTWQLATLTAVPLVAWLQRGLFRGSDRNFAEGLAFQLYVTGHLHLASIVLSPVGLIGQEFLILVRSVVALTYVTWAAQQFFGGSGAKAFGKVLLLLLAQALVVLAVMIYAVFPILEVFAGN